MATDSATAADDRGKKPTQRKPRSRSAPKPKTLAGKWAAILGELEAIPRNGHAEVQTRSGGSYSYDYVLESDLMEALRPKLAAHGIAAFYSDEILSQEPIGDSSYLQTTVRVSLTLVDADNPEDVMVLTADDTAADLGDKGARKAKTGAVRYLLLKGTLNPSDALDDPDAESNVVERPAAAKPEPPKKPDRAARSRADSKDPRDVRLRRTIVQRANEVDEVAEQPPGSTLGAIVAELGTDLDGLAEDALVALGNAVAKHIAEARAAKHDGSAIPSFVVPADVKPVPFG
jgi:hypothetical protein